MCQIVSESVPVISIGESEYRVEYISVYFVYFGSVGVCGGVTIGV